MCFDNAILILNDATTVNANSAAGLTMMQAGYDNEIFALKSSDVAHGLTDLTETATYYSIQKQSGSSGGLNIMALTEASRALWLRGIGLTETTTDTTSDGGQVCIVGATDNGGTNIGTCQANANIVALMNNATTRVIVKGDGTVHASDTSWATSLDTEDDILALRMLDKAQSTKGVIDSAWDSMIGTDWEYLQDIGIAGSTNQEKGRPDMFSIQGISKLTMGATWYMAQNFMAFLEVMEKEIPGIRKKYETHMVEQSGRPAMLTQGD